MSSVPAPSTLGLLLRGMAMGIAEVIPGVSGGTIAFITGIYTRLLDCIRALLGPDVWRAWRHGGLPALWQVVQGGFLLRLLAGMLLGLVLGVLVVSHLLLNAPVLLWSFFFGLILASSVYVARQVVRWNTQLVLILLLGIAVAYGITLFSPATGSAAPHWVFLAGMIAISALILPGVSGSFILLLMGMYSVIIEAARDVLQHQTPHSLMLLLVFMAGCLLGLAVFSRVLGWLFRHYAQPTLALLCGFMLGSLNKIWPWRVPVLGMTSEGEVVAIEPAAQAGDQVDKIVREANLSPWQFAEQVAPSQWPLALLCLLAGAALVGLMALGERRHPMRPEQNPGQNEEAL